ncbi:sensor histidine kinase [Treponema phagedenis]|uniref:sensor histidine kinase n=1 Tax=Treponema phagedenis TaxID=162 RepID=UPI0001F639E8|nr:HAMP domain-containing sensor histidine kinase [Treponema phagedenis]EFW39246.1 ATPase/histidine kinase/DNA gyrase B/HSP90 domain protein [Treponema phagedenis F0421]TYT78102.1 HAMP domain-containing histidine kinase [Treponema phagedenis]
MKALNKTSLLFLIAVLFFVNIFVFGIYKINERKIYAKLCRIASSLDANNTEKFIGALKSENKSLEKDGSKILKQYGYVDEIIIFKNQSLYIVLCCFFVSAITILFFCIANFYIKNKQKKRIEQTIKFIKTLEAGNYKLAIKEDPFSILDDEIYKTLVLLRETKVYAQQEKENYKKKLENISHQLKIPITSINIMFELFEDSNPELYKKIAKNEFIQKMQVQLERLERLTEILLTLSKLDSGAITMTREEFLLEECLMSAVEIIEEDLLEKKLMPSIKADGIRIQGDFYWIAEAFLNILKNFSDLYPAVNSISVSAVENSVYTEVRFENKGPQISDEDLKNIFKRFYKTKNNTAGFGIGLSITKIILEKNNAEIRAENKSDGVAFIIKFYS